MVKSHDTEDWHFADVGVYEIELSEVPESELQRGDFLEVEESSWRLTNLEPESKFLLRGYPSEFNFPDYDSRTLQITPFELEGTYAGTDESSQHCSRIHFGSLTNIKSSDGFSGSPVFECQELPERSTYRFAGMLVRAGDPCAETFCGTFIQAGVIMEALRRIINGDDQAERTVCSPLVS